MLTSDSVSLARFITSLFQTACGHQNNVAFTQNDLQKDFFFLIKLNQLIQKIRHCELILLLGSELQAKKRKNVQCEELQDSYLQLYMFSRYCLDNSSGYSSLLDHHPS